jgi:Uma2 family endonuclease
MTTLDPIALTTGEQSTSGLPMDDFIRLFDAEGPFELINGERIRKLPNAAEHSDLLELLFRLLLRHEDEANIVVRMDKTYALSYSPDWVKGSRIPDLMVYRAERLAAYRAETPGWGKMPYLLIPDLCVEVISPNDHYDEVDDKVLRYLNDGVRLVWIVNPRNQTIRVHRAEQGSTLLTLKDTLDGGDVIPALAVPVSQIFAE